MVIDGVEVIRSRRRTLLLELGPQGTFRARVPLRMPEREIRAFIAERRDWMEAQRQKYGLGDLPPKLTDGEISELRQKAKDYIPGRAAYWAGMLGLEYGRVTIKAQRTKWGSCSSKRNLNFNLLLMLTPQEVIDSVVVHELCHLRELNHSPRFYALVRAAMPDYDTHRRWLRLNGPRIMARL